MTALSLVCPSWCVGQHGGFEVTRSGAVERTHEAEVGRVDAAMVLVALEAIESVADTERGVSSVVEPPSVALYLDSPAVLSPEEAARLAAVLAEAARLARGA
jgi:hypothetical protein